MGRVRVTFWPVVGIVGFIVFVLCGLGLAVVAVIFVGGAPHAFPPSPGIAAILFLLALLFVALGGVLLRRSIRALSAMRQSGSQQQVRTSLYVVAGAALLVVVGAIVFPWVYKPWRPAKGSVQHADYMVEPTLRSACAPDAHRIFYRDRLVTKVARETTFSPRNPARLLYTVACANDGSESGVFYFDGARGAPATDMQRWLIFRPDRGPIFFRTCSRRKMTFFRASNFAAGHQMERNWLSSSLRRPCARIARCSASRTWYR
ncbi:MAG: hypothetical protein DMG42_10610 [Acidobacteria bacterium]|nr:MAG: hypothetical protein DMG42_10610 [Acidobacteriota bacterium]